MKNPLLYGKPPYEVAVLHGGPGALGEMAPVARELARQRGVLEPLQTRNTIKGLLAELKEILLINAHCPIVLIGHSWGAWLGFLFAAKHPKLVKKLILVSSGPFEAKYESRVMKKRLKRLNAKKRREVTALLKDLWDARSFARLGQLMSEADSYDVLPSVSRGVKLRPDLFQSVWNEAAEMRKNGELLEQGRKIRCPVIAIHGDYDPHPASGVNRPLAGVLKNFRFVLLKHCGHVPWMEKQARVEFFGLIREELK
jgi:pimeloyl-ACP methyl ester carboxylesterase